MNDNAMKNNKHDNEVEVELVAQPSSTSWFGFGSEDEVELEGRASPDSNGSSTKGSVEPSDSKTSYIKKRPASPLGANFFKMVSSVGNPTISPRRKNKMGAFSPGKQDAILNEDDYDPQPSVLIKPDNDAGFVQRVLNDIRGKDLASFEKVMGVDPLLMNVAPHVKSMKHLTFGKARGSEERKLERAAFLLVSDIKHRIDTDLESRSDITKLAFYLLTVLIFMNMVMYQSSIFTGQNQVIHQTITAGLFTEDTETIFTHDGSVKGTLVFPGTDTTDGILDWFNTNILTSIFAENDCGDDVCSAPEEYPYFQASTSAREFSGCKKDCDSAPTARVIVDFFDPWKLQQAYDTVYNALDNGWDYGDGSTTAKTLGASDRYPGAGWNICSRTHNEYGFYDEDGDQVHVCMFDSDLTIDGLPYRTAELEYGGDDFGGSTAVSLFDGEWEVRIAFENFTWGYEGKNIPIAFPAVRGQIINFDSGSAVYATWDPCAAARNCTCEWYRDGQYYCWKPSSFDLWSHEFEYWVEQENLGWVAEFLGMNLNYTNPSPLNTSILEDDTWITWSPCKNAGTHTLVLLAGYYSDDFYADDAAYDNADDGDTQWGTDAMMYLYEVDPVTGDDELLTSATVDGSTYDHIADLELYMCPSNTYKIRVAAGSDDDDGDSRTSWALFQNFDYSEQTEDDDDYRNVECEYPCKLVAFNFYSTNAKCSFYGNTGLGIDCGDSAFKATDDGAYYYYDDDGGGGGGGWYDDFWFRRLSSEEDGSTDNSTDASTSSQGTAYGATGANRRRMTREEASDAHFRDTVKKDNLRMVAGVNLNGDPLNSDEKAKMVDASRRARADKDRANKAVGTAVGAGTGTAVPSFAPTGGEKTRLLVATTTSANSTPGPTAEPTAYPTAEPTEGMEGTSEGDEESSFAPTPVPTTPVPTPVPTTPVPTTSPVPTTPEEKASEWLREGEDRAFSLAEAAAKATLPFTIGTTDCDTDTIGDGTCDASTGDNNDMNCGFDDGDCCASTCYDTDGAACSSSATYDCQSPAGATKRVNYSPQEADWPFATSNGDLTYPFSMQKGIMQVLEGQGSAYTDDYTVLPSLTCPDCNSHNGSYLSIPFTVNTSKPSYSMFPDLESTRERTLLEKYRVVGGVLLTQKRNDLMRCKNFPKKMKEIIGSVCNFAVPAYGNVLDAVAGDSNTDHFGVDPTYVSTETLYRASNFWKEQYTEDELKSSEVPYGFFYDGGCTDCSSSHRVRDYPIMFDVNFNVSRTAKYLTMLEEGGYLDSMTSELKVSIPLLSLEFGKPTIVSVYFNPLPAGGWSMNYDVITMDFNIVYPNGYFGLNSGGQTTSSRDHLRCFFEILWGLSFLYLVWEETNQLRREMKERGHPFGYFLDAGNILDILNFIAQWMALLTFYDIYRMVQSIEFTSDLHYDVYADSNSVGRMTQVTRKMADYQDLVETVEDIVSQESKYANIVCMSFLLVCLQLLKNLNFHPKLGIITRTLGGAASDLTFFMVLFVMVNVLFSYLGCFIFGNFSSNWNSLPNAFLTCLQLLIGMYDPTSDIGILDDPSMANVFLWSYVVISFFVLLNALLAIIVESYDRTKTEAESERATDATTVMIRKLCGHHSLGLNTEIALLEEDMVRFFNDMSMNMKAVHRVTLPGTKVDVTQLPVQTEHKAGDDHEPSIPPEILDYEDQKGKSQQWPKVVYENIDGSHKLQYPDMSELDIHLDSMHPLRKMQVRLPNHSTQAMVDCDVNLMQTNNLFYMLNKFADDGTPHIVLLDQTALVCAMRTVCPTLNIACAYGIALNVLVRYGVNADINGDGVISPDEWAALDEILRSQEKAMKDARGDGSGRHTNKSRLISLMF